MQKVTAIVIDDEAPAREVIKNYLQDFPQIELLCECSDGFQGLKMIGELQPQLVFLDIQMPKLTGFEMLEVMDEKPVVIFSTAYDQYALKAFEVSAADYLLKPYSRARFAEAVNRAFLLMQDQKSHEKVLERIDKQQEEQTEYLQRVVVKIGRHIQVVSTDKILWLEAQDDYVMLHTKDGEFLKSRTMKYFEEHLSPDDFVRIHRSHIVQISHIKQIELFGKESYRVLLKSGEKLPISKSGHARLKELLD